MTIQLFLAFTSVSALPLYWLERPLYAYEVRRVECLCVCWRRGEEA